MEMVSDGVGGAILVWEDRRNFPDIYVQRVDVNGNDAWTADGVLMCGAGNTQNGPKITTDGAGGAIVAWNDRRSNTQYDIYVQHIDAAGTMLWPPDGAAVCTNAADQTDVAIASDGRKGAIMAWVDQRAGNANIYTQRVDSLGNMLWTADGVMVCTQIHNQAEPCVVSDGDAGAYICWLDYRSGTRVYAQRVDSLGAVQWAVNGINFTTTTTTPKYDLTMIADGTGGAILAWCDNRVWYDLYAQRVDADGNHLWTVGGKGVCIAPEQQRYPQMISDGSGGMIVTWRDNRSVALEPDIYVRRVRAAGDTVWTYNGVAVCTAAGAQDAPQITTDGSDGAIITWEDYRGASRDIFAQRIDGFNATAVWAADGVPVCTAENYQDDPRIVTDGSGGGIVAWVDQRNASTSAKDIHISGVDADGDPKVPVFLSHFAADVDGDRVALRWTVAEASDRMDFYVLRAEAKSDLFREVKSPVIEGGDLSFEFTDDTCEPGKSYRYRVDVSDEEGRRTLFHTEAMEIPAAAVKLVQNSPNPFNPLTKIRFYLPSDNRVTLSVYDPQGRLVTTVVDGVHRAGWNEIEWIAIDRFGAPLSSGVYLCRLQAGKQTLTKKMMVLK
jgi:hypothetical protein